MADEGGPEEQAGFEVEVSSDGAVDAPDLERAEDKLRRVASVAPGRVLLARLRLAMEPAPARPRPAKAQGSLDVDGRVVRAQVAAPTMPEAVDLMVERLRDQLDHLSERLRFRRRTGQPAEAGTWRSGDLPTQRPEFFARPPDDRRVVRRKTFAPGAMTPDEAVLDMELLDHDFFLFTDVDTGDDSVVYRAGDGYRLIRPTPSTAAVDGWATPLRLAEETPPRLSLDDAVRVQDGSDAPFLFFLDDANGRGHVLYRRYDGHYGLITPADG